jgi:hypothetical protein
VKKRLVLICSIAMVGVSLACSDGGRSAMTPAVLGPSELGPDGATLKIDAPSPTGPGNGTQVQGNPTLSWGGVNGKFKTFSVTYQVELRHANGSVQTLGPTGNTSISAANLAFDTNYTWKVRVFLSSAQFGPWSNTMNFRTQPGQYLNGNPEILDPLKNGSTVGQIIGFTTFVPGVGLRLENQQSYVAYSLPTHLQDGEFSFMATNVDEGNPGDKSKVMSMGEGCHVDVTDNDYRNTLEVRGRDYQGSPGTVSFRIITGDADEHAGRIKDIPRSLPGWTRTENYFFKIWWKTTSVHEAGFEIRRGSPTGPLHDEGEIGTSGHPYRPAPHCVYLGAPPSRGGPGNQTHAGMTVWDVWFSRNPRPAFLGGTGATASVPSLFTQPGK